LRGTAWLATGAIACASACSAADNPQAGSATLTGTVRGSPIPTSNTTALLGPVSVPGSSSDVNALLVIVSNQPAVCAILARDANPPSSTALEITIASLGVIGPGTFAIGTPNPSGDVVTLDYLVDDSACATLTSRSAHAVSGTVTITAISGSLILGAFDAELDSNDHLSGSISAPVCSVDINGVLGASATPTCGG
jgi:hypothetical protein